jgi:hypothetical protein
VPQKSAIEKFMEIKRLSVKPVVKPKHKKIRWKKIRQVITVQMKPRQRKTRRKKNISKRFILDNNS